MPEILQNIKAENRLDKIRIVSENDDVIGGQPSSEGNEENDNNAIFDLASTASYAIEKVKNAQDTADSANGKATAAQIKADQVPNPIKDKFLVGNTTTAYALKTTAEVKDLLGINDDIPVGVIVEWDHEEAPKKWLFVRNQKFSDVEYPELAKLYPSLILTDRRGVVSRGLDAGRGLDPGRVLGSYQEDATPKITGDLADLWVGTNNKATDAFYQRSHNNSLAFGGGNVGGFSNNYAFDSSRVFNKTANEVRMKNIATNFIIKAK